MKKQITVLLLAAFLSATAAHAQRATVKVESGTLLGEQTGDVVAYRGIPYAAPPVGELRWQAPKRVARWKGEREALKFGAACPQDPKLGGNPQPIAEDCLYLNVWAPAGAKRSSLPVMVYLHGGGFVAGAGFQNIYYGHNFARDGVVLVSINYRLGSLGFFAHPALGGKGGNYALLDQIAALEWVQRNIAAFGGDPRRVTLFGESAGGYAVLFLMTNATDRPLFQQAIAQSAPGYKRPKTRATQEANDIKLAEAAGVPVTGTAAQLRALAPEKLFGDYSDVGPFIDSELVRQFPLPAFEAKQARRIPLIIGSNSDEGSLVRVYPRSVPDMLNLLGDRATAIRAAYGEVSDDKPRFERQFFGDAVFGASSRHIANLHSAVAPSFLYQFDYLTASLRGQRPGAAHVSEVPYVFDTLANWPIPATDEDQAMATRVHACWVTFAKTGKPACEGEGAWPAYDPAKDNTFMFRIEGPRTEHGYRARQFDAIQTAVHPLAIGAQ